MTALFQAGLISAMLEGIYEGDVDFKTLAQHGDTGLGTLNGINGEMVALDGRFYRIDVEGVANVIEPNALTPFSVVAKHKPTLSCQLENVESMAQLNAALDAFLPTLNIFYMIRIDTELDWVKLRSESCQTGQKRPLSETLPQLQKIYELTTIKGSLIATRCPTYSASITISGYHYHFINEEKTTGGHVFDMKFKKAIAHITPLRKFNMVLFNTQAFDDISLPDTLDNEALNKVER